MNGDHREGVGDLQKMEAEEVEELREEDDDDDTDGRENLEMDVREGEASNLGDLSRKGSCGGELKSRDIVLSRKPMMPFLGGKG